MPARLDPARYVLCGDPAADARVAQDLARLGAGLEAELGDALRSLILVGPYARAEGSAVAVDGELHPAGEYPLIALHDASAAMERADVAAAAQQWSELLSVTVRIRAYPLSALPRVPRTLQWMEVSHSQCTLVGGLPGHLHDLPRIEPSAVPASELTYLLSSAACDVALARLQPDPMLALLSRAVHHAVLSLGDAALIGGGRYAPSLVERAALLEHSGVEPWLDMAYRDAIRYTARPDLWTPPGGEGWYGEALQRLRHAHLAMEHRRVGSPRVLERLARWGGRLFTDYARASKPWQLLWSHRLPREERWYRSAMLLAYGTTERTREAAVRLLATRRHPHAGANLQAQLAALADDVAHQRHEHPVVFGRYA